MKQVEVDNASHFHAFNVVICGPLRAREVLSLREVGGLILAQFLDLK